MRFAMNSSHEVIVIGAGPAGSTASAILAEAGHDVLLLEKVKHLPTRLWYMQQTIEQGWSAPSLVTTRNRSPALQPGMPPFSK
jgi:NADPH-dependent glutamate synthase beta subunit-like oxidoreductase